MELSELLDELSEFTLSLEYYLECLGLEAPHIKEHLREFRNLLIETGEIVEPIEEL